MSNEAMDTDGQIAELERLFATAKADANALRKELATVKQERDALYKSASEELEDACQRGQRMELERDEARALTEKYRQIVEEIGGKGRSNTLVTLQRERDEALAQVAMLREALIRLKGIYEDEWEPEQLAAAGVPDWMRRALAATPADALKAHDAEVRKRALAEAEHCTSGCAHPRRCREELGCYMVALRKGLPYHHGEPGAAEGGGA